MCVCVAHGAGRAQNNEIEVLENLPLKKLQKLYVEGNRISCAPLVLPTAPSAYTANSADDEWGCAPSCVSPGW